MVEFDIKETDEDQILREVWDTNNIETKTELHDGQIETINKLQTMGMLFGCDVIIEHTKLFMRMQKSRNRRSMNEFTGVVTARKDPNIKDMSMLGKLMG